MPLLGLRLVLCGGLTSPNLNEGVKGMQLLSFKIGKGQVQGRRLRVGGRCGCGCSTRPFVMLSDGERGLTLRFENGDDLTQFKCAVKNLTMNGYGIELEIELRGESSVETGEEELTKGVKDE